jgi:ferredoxin
MFGSSRTRYAAPMRLTIDVTRCEGHGRCYDLAPALFRPDDEGHADLVAPAGQIPTADEASALAAVRNCPEHALTLEP